MNRLLKLPHYDVPSCARRGDHREGKARSERGKIYADAWEPEEVDYNVRFAPYNVPYRDLELALHHVS